MSQTSVVIPTPDASRLYPNFERFYTPNFIIPKTLIKFSAQVEDCIECPYCLDERDDAWLKEFKKKCDAGVDGLKAEDYIDDDLFEKLMYTLELVGIEKVWIMYDA